jgi:filamentous hemagglutinin family protein
MIQNESARIFYWAIAIAAYLTTYINNGVLAQIVPDNTLRTERSLVKSNVNTRGLPADLIEGGATRGVNLFHSFSEFNVKEKQRVYFANPPQIEKILSRVTGNHPSNILGTLGVLGNANLFLINPNGIIFGQNARLDIQGSFLASTANSLIFSKNFQFSATNPQAPPLLTIHLTPGLQYGSNPSQATIANAGNLSVGKDLTLSAQNLNLQGQLSAGRNLTLQASDAVTGNAHYLSGGNFRIEKLNKGLGKLSSPHELIIRAGGDISFDSYEGASLHILAGGSVNIPGNITIESMDTTENLIRDRVTLSDGTTTVDIDGNKYPILDIRAGTKAFNSTGSSFRETGTNADIKIGSITNQGGVVFLTNQYQPNINRQISHNINVNSIETGVPTGAFGGNGGSVYIDAKNNIIVGHHANLNDNDAINADGSYGFVSSDGLGGNIVLLSEANIDIQGSISSQSDSQNQGTGGKIRILADSLSLSNKAELSTKTLEVGNAGDIIIHARDSVSLKEQSSIISEVGNNATANAGNIEITTDSLEVIGTNDTDKLALDGTVIESRTRGTGNAGNITINANSVSIENGASLNSGVENTGMGTGGNIKITTDSLSLNKASLFADTLREGDSGDITINATESVSIDKSNVLTSVGTRENGVFAGKGQGGNIDITTPELSLTNQAQISASNIAGTGNGGDINLTTRSLSLDNAQIVASTAGIGNAGNIKVENANAVALTNNSSISTSDVNKREDGQGGNVEINTDSLTLDRGTISATTDSTEGGDIILNVKDLLLLRNGSQITAKAAERGSGGNITINAGTIFAIPQQDNDIIANAELGNGGNIKISTQGLFNLEERKAVENNGTNDIDASSDFGVDGEVTIDSPNVDPSRRLVRLPNLTIVPEVLQGCRATTQQTASRFINTGRGGFPPGIEESNNNTVWEDLRTPTLNADRPSETETVDESNSTSPVAIVEAQGLIIGSNGEIILSAQPSKVTPYSNLTAPTNCHIDK